jgi:hypothetical protein
MTLSDSTMIRKDVGESFLTDIPQSQELSHPKLFEGFK